MRRSLHDIVVKKQVEQIQIRVIAINTRIRGFSGSGFELIAGLQVALGLERVDLVGGDGRDDVNEGVDDGSMLIEGGELLDIVGHVPGIEQGFILQR
jgi:hypothetical protein